MLGEILSAYEFLDSECMRLLNTHLKLTNPICGMFTHTHTHTWCVNRTFFHLADCQFYILIETSGSEPAHDEEKLHNFLEEAMTSSLVNDGTVATEDSKIQVCFPPPFNTKTTKTLQP